MRFIFSFLFLFTIVNVSWGNTWSYQVKVNSEDSKTIPVELGKTSFDAGPYFCEVSPVSVNDNTEYRTLTCSVGVGSVSTGALCTRKGHKFPSVQYAILNLYGPKNLVNVAVACHFN